MSSKSRSTKQQQAKLFRIPGSLIGIIVSFVFLIREGIAGAADILQLAGSINGFAAIVGIVFLVIFNIALSLYIRSHAIEASPQRESSQHKIIRRKFERRAIHTYAAISLFLILIVAIQAIALLSIIQQNMQVVVYKQAINWLNESNGQKSSTVPMPAPPNDATIVFFDDFDTTYKVGQNPRNMQFAWKTDSEIVQDTDNPGNQALQITSGEYGNIVAFHHSLPSVYSVTAYRMKYLAGVEYQYVEGMSALQAGIAEMLSWNFSDGEWHLLVDVHNGENSKRTMIFDGEVVFEGTDQSIPDQTGISGIGFGASDVVLLDDLMVWTTKYDPLTVIASDYSGYSSSGSN